MNRTGGSGCGKLNDLTHGPRDFGCGGLFVCVTMTLDRYSHAVPDLQSEAAEKTDALLRGLLGTD